MSEQDVKIKVSTVPPAIDNYTNAPKTSTVGSEKGDFGPGSSAFEMESKMSSGWKAMAKSSSGLDLPGLENGDVLSLVAPYCEEVNQQIAASHATGTLPYFIPKTPLEHLQFLYDVRDPTAQVDLKKSLPKIPSFASMYKDVGDFDYIRIFYTNRLGLIGDLIKNSENEIKKNKDPFVIRARKEFLVYLNEKKYFVHNQLGKLVTAQTSKKSVTSS